jgi:hypothetical protein
MNCTKEEAKALLLDHDKAMRERIAQLEAEKSMLLIALGVFVERDFVFSASECDPATIGVRITLAEIRNARTIYEAVKNAK